MDVAALDRRTPRPLVLTGGRCIGKSVLLGEIATLAADRYGWLTVHAEVRPDEPFIGMVIERLGEVQDVLEDAAPGPPSEVQALAARLGAVGGGDAADGARQRPPTKPAGAALDRALTAAGDAAAARTSGVLLAVDDLHLANAAELDDLVAPLHRHVPDAWPLVVVVAGQTAGRYPGRTVPYLEGAECHALGLLPHDDTVLALRRPAASGGRPLSPDGATLLAEASGGHPYAVQVLGHHAWCTSVGAPAITVEHARAALAPADAELAEGLYEPLWHDASPEERVYLRAVAHLDEGGGAVTDGAVAAHLGQAPEELTGRGDRLVEQGALVATGRALRFPMPGMAGWITGR